VSIHERVVRRLGEIVNPSVTDTGTNPRYVAYCRAHGHPDDPDGMLAEDRARYPGGAMVGFILWIRGHWDRWHALNPHVRREALTQADHDAFDQYLAEAVP
jgi:hypothetical protein